MKIYISTLKGRRNSDDVIFDCIRAWTQAQDNVRVNFAIHTPNLSAESILAEWRGRGNSERAAACKSSADNESGQQSVRLFVRREDFPAVPERGIHASLPWERRGAGFVRGRGGLEDVEAA